MEKHAEILAPAGGEAQLRAAVLCGDEECPFSELLEKATKALYRAKRLGKGTCCLWHDEAEKDICL